MEIKNLFSELAANPEGSFLDLVSFNGNQFGTCDITGVSPVWEMHPETDEFFYVVEGEFEVTLLEEAGESHHVAPAGTTLVIPRGLWHRPGAPKGAKLLYFTPGQSLHSDAQDPRVE